jgi:hypothetical protein
MRNSLWTSVTLLLLAGTTQAVEYGDIKVEYIPMHVAGETLNSGYVEWQFLITNKGDSERQVAIKVPADAGYNYYANSIQSLSRSVVVNGNSSSRISMFQPATMMTVNDIVTVYIDGRKQERSFSAGAPTTSAHARYARRSGVYYGSSSSYGTSTRPTILLSRGVDENLVSRWGSVAIAPPPSPTSTSPGMYPMMPAPMVSGVVGPNFARSLVPIDQWSTSYLRYHGLEGVLITGREWEDLNARSPGIRAALMQYVEAGGILTLVGALDPKSLPESWLRNEKKRADYTVRSAGFGFVFHTVKTDQTKFSNELVDELSMNWNQASSQLTKMRGAYEANNSFPVVEDSGIPIKGLFVLMILFAVLIGPLNLTMLSRVNRRIWMLWTVPLISFLACFMIFGFMILEEGWTATTRREGVTLLDQSSGRTTTLGIIGVYSPLGIGSGLEFETNSSLTLQGQNDESREAISRSLDWSNGQRLTEGWLAPRLPLHFAINKVENRKERLTFHTADGTISVVNGLGVDIVNLWYADAKGNIHSLKDLSAGASGSLSNESKMIETRDPLQALRTVYQMDTFSLTQQLRTRPQVYLQPNSYIAEIVGTPFIERGLTGAIDRSTNSMVYGLP